ncbi:hypothetical protein D3C76_1204050 [compost metagenome]
MPPLLNSDTMAAKPARWNIGMECRKIVPATQRPITCDARELKHTPLWLSITPLGKPVVPPV